MIESIRHIDAVFVAPLDNYLQAIDQGFNEEIAFDPFLMRDAMMALGGKCKIYYTGKLKPIYLESEHGDAVVLPMRVY